MKRMMLYIDGGPSDEDCLRYAAGFTGRFDARLQVAHLKPLMTDVGSVKRAIDVAERSARLAHQAFTEVCGELESAAWLETDEGFEDTLRRQGRLHDLTMLKRLSEVEGPEALVLNITLFESGAPVMVLPPSPPETLAETVALVWSPTVQSARALRSALPLLAQAKRVLVLINAENPTPRPDELNAYLADHGIAGEITRFGGPARTARGRGRAILEAVRDEGADFVVMGAYGENRLQSILGLGRTTQKLVSGAPVPVFLQH